MAYSDGFKERMIEKMLEIGGPSVAALARETGVGESTLWRWRYSAVNGENVSHKNSLKKSPRRHRRSPKQKIRIVMQAGGLPDDELGAFMREEGLHEADLERLREEVFQAAEQGFNPPKKHKDSAAQKELKALKKELARKEKALAETAALLVLRGKLEAFLSAEEEGCTTPRSDR